MFQVPVENVKITINDVTNFYCKIIYALYIFE